MGTIEAMKAEVTERGSSRTKEVSDFVDQLRKEVQDLKGDVETQKQEGADVAGGAFEVDRRAAAQQRAEAPPAERRRPAPRSERVAGTNRQR